jgi:hypothetical protein
MPIIRLMLILVFIASLVLLAVYIATRNKKYLTYLKQLLRYTAWSFSAIFVLYLITRVIRL